MFHHTGSSNPGNAFCCKPDSNTGYCESGASHKYAAAAGAEDEITTICSQPSVGASDKFADILTGYRNLQMFAFCPDISPQKCGIQNAEGREDANMSLLAGLDKTMVRSKEMRYLQPSREDPDGAREYDACHYEIAFDKSLLATHTPKYIHLQIATKIEMNVYLYGGNSRVNATESVVAGND